MAAHAHIPIPLPIKRPHGPLTLTWREYEASAPYASPRWAASDRGWLNAALAAGSVAVPLGNYLYYPDREGAPPIHATCSVSGESSWHDDISAARDWIERRANERGIVEYVLAQLLARGEVFKVSTEKFGVVLRQDDSIAAARKWAKGALGVTNPRCVSAVRGGDVCEACDCKPCACWGRS